MAKEVINIGTTANDRTGDPLRTCFIKTKSNFDELYAVKNPAGEAENDFVVAGPDSFAWVRKTLAQVKTILGLPSVVADNDFQVGSSGAWVKKTLAETKAILNIEQAFQVGEYSPTINVDVATYRDWRYTLLGNADIDLVNSADGMAGCIEVFIDETGGYTVNLGIIFAVNLNEGTIDATANKKNFIFWFNDGVSIKYWIIVV